MTGIGDLINKDLSGSSKQLESIRNVKQSLTIKQERKYIQKYSWDGILAEAVLIDNVPYFLVSNKGEISIETELNTPSGIMKPLEANSYLNRPYSFNSKKQVQECIERTKNESLDTLFKKVKSIWSKYIDADNFHLSICAADTIFTFFQDRMGLIHYLFFVGNNGSGKSNNLKVFQILAYRNMTSTDITPANIYQFLGSDEEGIGTICEDEADTIDNDLEKMKIYKNGYTTGSPVFRTDTSFGRKQHRMYTFCFKAFAGERLPDSLKAKGLNQRIIEIQCVYGFPKYDISEVVNPAGDNELQELLDELINVRNTLLIYRLLHFHENIPDIELNLQNREKQLFKSIIRLFQNTDTLAELLPVVSKYVSQKREQNADSFNAFLYGFVKHLMKKYGVLQFDSAVIWAELTDEYSGALPGKSLPHKPMSYESEQFGTISLKSVIETLQQVFGAKPTSDGKKRGLLFDKDKLERIGSIYELSFEVRVGTELTDITGLTDVGLDRHQKSADLNPDDISEEVEKNFYANRNLGYDKIILHNGIRSQASSINPSNASNV